MPDSSHKNMSQDTNTSLDQEKTPQESPPSLKEEVNESRENTGKIALQAEGLGGTQEVVDVLLEGDEISEAPSTGRKNASDPVFSSAQGDDDEDDASILSTKIQEEKTPKKEQMAQVIRIAIREEIRNTKKKVRLLEKHAPEHAYSLSVSVDTLRKLYETLQEIAYKTWEYIESFWRHIRQGGSVLTF